MTTPATEAQLRSTIARFVEGVRNVTGDHLANVIAADDLDTDDACPRMRITCQWSDGFGNTQIAVGQFTNGNGSEVFDLERFQLELNRFVGRIGDQARQSVTVH